MIMAASTGLVVAAGAIVLTEHAVTGWEAGRELKVAVATVLAALVSGGLDRVLPGFGTGAAVLLLVAVLYRSGPPLLAKINLLPAK